MVTKHYFSQPMVLSLVLYTIGYGQLAFAATVNSQDLKLVNAHIEPPLLSSQTSTDITSAISTAANSTTIAEVQPTKSPLAVNPATTLILVGVYINGREVDVADVLYDTNAIEVSPANEVSGAKTDDSRPLNGDIKGVSLPQQQDSAKQDSQKLNNPLEQQSLNQHYYISLAALTQLIGVTFTPLGLRDVNIHNDTANNDTANNDIANNDIANNDIAQNSRSLIDYQVSTPIGDTTLAARQIMVYKDQPYLALSALKQLGVYADYHQQDLAIKLNMGWQPNQRHSNTDMSADDITLKIDHYPTQAGLLGLRVDSGLSISDTANSDAINRHVGATIGAYGYALGGVWGVNAKGYDSSIKQDWVVSSATANDHLFDGVIDGVGQWPWNWQQWRVDNLYWAKSGEKFATRLGVNQPNVLGQGALISGAKFTGAMLAYSSQDISRHLDQFDDTSSSLLSNTSQDLQHLTGEGAAGGVAELRINGRAIARVQIGLDGRYEFLNLDVNRLNLNETSVEIAIYPYPLARQPLEIRPILLSNRRTNVATGELLLEGGLGQVGNWFEDNWFKDDSNKFNNGNNVRTNSGNLAAHSYAEYGINNKLAVRGGVNTSQQFSSTAAGIANNDIAMAWHIGANIAANARSNIDLSYAHAPNQDIWQTQLLYANGKLMANYHYQGRLYHESPNLSNNGTMLTPATTSTNLENRHQLLLNYRPNKDTLLNFNQYYNDWGENKPPRDENYFNYTSIYHRFNDQLNAGLNWNSRDDSYGYLFLWQDKAPNDLDYKGGFKNQISRPSLGISGNNDSETVSLGYALTRYISLSQSIAHQHHHGALLYQGDVNFEVNNEQWAAFSAFSKRLDLGYSLYKGNIGWRGDLQLSHQNGISASIGYEHQYVGGVAPLLDPLDSMASIGFNGQPLASNRNNDPWTQDNFLYARFSFDMYKAPKQPLRFGRLPLQRSGSVIVDITHPPEPVIDTDNISFSLDKQKVNASLLSQQATHSQYVIDSIKAGDYTLALDGKNLPIEYSTSELPTPTVRVSNYAPTLVPITLQKTYGISAKLADAKEGVLIEVYRQNDLIESVQSGSYGYFQVLGLVANTYTLKAEGYTPQDVTIKDDFVMQIVLQPHSGFSEVKSGAEKKDDTKQ